MSKNNGGFFSFVMGLAAGATALFLSKPANRQKASKAVAKTVRKVKQAEAEFKKNPKAFEKKVATKAKAVVKKAVKQAVKKAKSTKVVIKTKKK